MLAMIHPIKNRFYYVEVYVDLFQYSHVRVISGNIKKSTRVEKLELCLSELDAIRKINDIENKLRNIGYQYLISNDVNEFVLVPQYLNEI